MDYGAQKFRSDRTIERGEDEETAWGYSPVGIQRQSDLMETMDGA
jgi:hypothetical protein